MLQKHFKLIKQQNSTLIIDKKGEYFYNVQRLNNEDGGDMREKNLCYYAGL